MENLKDLIPGVKENELLKNHATFKIGGPAKYFFEAKTKEELIIAVKGAEKLKIRYFILGGGSNVLISDDGYDGLVIKQSNCDFKIDGDEVYAESGVMVVDLLDATLKADLVGWAWAAGLPGTIGGAVRGNAGAYGEAMSDAIVSVEMLVNGEVKDFTKEEMHFNYRHSIAKEIPAIVLSINMKLKKGDTTQDKELVAKYIDYRHRTQPLDLPNSGCVFKNVDLIKNPVNEEKVISALDITQEEYKQATKHNKLPVSFILDRMGLKGRKMGGAQVSDKHGAFIVNIGGATAEHVIMLMSDIKMKVRNELGIQLEEEIQYVGF